MKKQRSISPQRVGHNNETRKLWSSSSTIRPLVSRQRMHTPDLFISQITTRSGHNGLDATFSTDLEDASHSSPQLLHPSDFVGDPDEARDFSTVRTVMLRPSKGITPLPRKKRLVASLEPIHSLEDAVKMKHLNSWPAHSRSMLSSSQATLRPQLSLDEIGELCPSSEALRNVTLGRIRQFVDDEMRLVRTTDRAAVLSVYREAFSMLVDEFSTFAPLLNEIRNAYEGRLMELEETVQVTLLGDKGVQEEKEKFLSMQSVTMLAFEREKRSIDALRVRALDSEEARAKAERLFDEKLAEVHEEIQVLKDKLLMERTVRMEHEDNLSTATRLMHTAREQSVVAAARLQEIESAFSLERDALTKECELLRSELRMTKLRFDEYQVSSERKYCQLVAQCVTEEKLAELKESSEKVNRTNLILHKRNKWLEAQILQLQQAAEHKHVDRAATEL